MVIILKKTFQKANICCCLMAFTFFLSVRGTAQVNTYYPDNIDSVACAFTPEAQTWGIVRSDSSSALSHMYAQPFIGDIDNDGHSEVVTAGYYGDRDESYSLVIYNDQLNLEFSYTTPEMKVHGGYPITVADVDNDGVAEIFVLAADGYLHCYNYNGSSVIQKWVSAVTTATGRSVSLMVADVNLDGIPDIWAMDKIFNARTGVVEVTLPEVLGQSNVCNNTSAYATMPVFADMDNDGILEFVGGNKVYKLTITNSAGTGGNYATLWKTLSSGAGVGDGLTSVADIDLDGYLDVVVVRSGYMYVWKPYFGSGSSPSLLGSFSYSASLPGSRALITDVDNDSYPEIIFTYVNYMVAYKYNATTHTLTQLWIRATTDDSGATTMTAFDFNQDGNVEVVYRDESNIRILNGLTGLNKTTFSCVSPTAVEYPAIVDLDRDGQAEIVVSSCTNNQGQSQSNMYGKLVSFKSPSGTRWAPARYVWNQHGYNVVNVNNDLTVPQYNFNPATAFTDPSGVVRRPFNNFLQQGTSLDQYGRPFYTVADAALANNDLSDATCDSIRLTLQLHNLGAVALSAPYKITVYKNQYRGQIIKTLMVNTTLSAFGTLQYVIPLYPADIQPFEPVNQLVVSINDAGYGIAQNANLQDECDTTNNLETFPYSGFNRVKYYTVNICEGQSYQDPYFHISEMETTVGIHDYRDTILGGSVFSCDSIINLHLIVNQLSTLNVTDTVCRGQGYHLHGFNLSAAQIDTSDLLKYHYEGTNVAGCDSTADLTLYVVNGSLEVSSLTVDFCDDYSATLHAETNLSNLLWNTGETTPDINIVSPGTYTAVATEGTCIFSDFITISPCDFVMYLPNAITPTNHDGLNDYFYIPDKITYNFQNFRIYIYNRWGELAFQSSDKNFRWDGSFHGKIMPNAVYSYVIQLTAVSGRQFVFKGSITVL